MLIYYTGLQGKVRKPKADLSPVMLVLAVSCAEASLS